MTARGFFTLAWIVLGVVLGSVLVVAVVLGEAAGPT